MDYSRGSVWRKWDLHIHTPASFDWASGKLLSLMSDAERDTAFEKMHSAIEGSDVDAFAVVDHWTIEGYLAFRQYLRTKDLTLNKLLLPGIEIRVEAPVNYKLNIQIIFSDKLNDQQLKDFLSKLKVNTNSNSGRQLSDDCLIEYAKNFDKSKAQKYGFADPATLGDDKLLELGKKTAKVTRESLAEAMQAIPENTAFVVQPYDTSDGLVNLDWETHPHDDNYFMQSASIFETRREDTVNLFLGVKTPENEKIIDNFQKTLGGKPKPAIAGSDAHKTENYGKFPGDKATWIKANPTFEGLRQITYEPQLRARIQADSPDTKKPYFVIDKVRFIDNSGANFPGSYIPINPDLTTIIGGKSTGKSLLLYYIAKTIDRKEVNGRLTVGGTFDEPYDFDNEPHFDFEVVWRDGTKQTLKDPDDDQNDRKILYIPQSYLNKLSEKNLHSKLTLNEFVLNVLLQDENARTKYSTAQKRISTLKKNIQNELTDLFQLAEEGRELAESIKQKGDAAGIRKYIKTLQAEIKSIKDKSGLTKTEMKTYEEKVGEIETRTEKIGQLQDDKENVASFHEALLEQSAGIKEVFEEYEELINNDSIRKRIEKEFAFVGELDDRFNESEQKITQQIDKEIKVEKARIKKLEVELKPLMSKVKLQSSITAKNKTLTEEQAKLNTIQLDQKKLDVKRKAYLAKQSVVFGYYSDIFGSYEALTKDFALYDNHFDDISLNVVTEFKVEPFNRDVVNEYLNKNDVKRLDTEQALNSEYAYTFDPTTHIAKIETIYKGLISNNVKTVKGRSVQDAISHLLEDLFYLDFKISYKGDPLQKMSPGKKGLVLLRLLIDLSDEEWPILLDQPEDDLDNRSIYNELAIYLAKKKQERQILIVTHNPNLVVTTDSEEVIVANQDDQELGRDNRKYKFEYVSGALEDSFELPETDEPSILYRKGIREHACEILEGGEEAFGKREEKYSLKSKK